MGVSSVGRLSILLIIFGNAIRYLAIKQLGNYFTVKLHIQNNQELIINGLFSYVRHPSYTGVIMSFIGLAFLLNNNYGTFAIILPVISVFLYRIYVEEKVLKAYFGSQYEKYQERVPMLIPRLW
ncbi:unnamed protein product [Didymodactylos carnosus]|uniref:Protein-S-isoprenylcysteine O-methyltransferase n=1 Tax=Didymodactylos carnosus TaxID=1234261 RepID=A0A813SNP6_9BILA|nr:unnamed protein product [Didymodactylos carnosus]CAF0798468.1 unnamed protein product [Didymodactylos carnosus]CAF3565001.1 unnamed protein product [Didymodactylos carnosus]CAF3583323.1 unnamed protein product [Didymodactylos carnosus]